MDKKPTRIAQYSSYLIVALIIALTGLLMEWISDTALVDGFVRRAIAHIFAPVDSFLYKITESDSPTQDRLIIVNIDKASFEHFHSNWPLSYGQHARVLNKILSYRPRAVFVDIQFEATREDPSLANLQQSLCAYAEAGVPIFLAAGSQLNEWRLRPGLEDLLGQNGKPCFKKVTVNYAPDGIDQTAWTYPIKIADTPQLDSAALAMAQVIGGAPIKVDGDEAEMGLTWSASSNQTGPDWGDADEAGKGQHYCRPPGLADLAPWNGLLAKVGLEVHDFRVACPLHQNIEAYRLTAPKSDDQELQLSQQIAGRAVFYGASFEANDFIVSPLQGRIPGIYLHAMATDNLLRFKSHWLGPDFDSKNGIAGGFALKFIAYILTTCYFLMVSNFFRWVYLGWTRWLVSQHHNYFGPPQWLVRSRLFVKAKVRRCIASVSQSLEKHDPTGRWSMFPVKITLETAAEPLGSMLSGTLFFFLMLPFAVVLCLIFEYWMGISIVGYSEVLVFCLFGEMLGKSHEIHAKIIENRKRHSHSVTAPIP